MPNRANCVHISAGAAANAVSSNTVSFNALVSGAKKASDVDSASWPDHLKAQAGASETWPNITEQKKALPGADDAAKEDNKIAALTLEPGA